MMHGSSSFSVSCCQLQQDKFRSGLTKFVKNLYLFMSWDRIEPPCLFCILTLRKFVLCSHPDLVRSKKSFRDFQSTVQNFSAMNSAWPCYACMESLNRMKIEEEHIYDKHFYRRDVNGVSLFHSHISLTGIFDIFKAKLKEGILKEEVENSAKRSRRLVYYCTLDFPVGTFPDRRRRRHHETRCVKVVCATSKCRNHFCRRVLPKIVITMFPYRGRN